MKAILLKTAAILFVTATSGSAIAQPTLNAASSNPMAGTSLRMLFTATSTTTASMASATGANQNWDVTGFAFTKRTDTLNFHACGAGDDCNRYPGTTILSSHPQVNGVAFDYYAASSTVLSRIGNNDSVAGTSFNHIYTNPLDILHFPMTYNNSFVDSFAILDTASNGTTTHYRRGDDTVLADGWGTLKTPSGTFTNTLRVKQTINVQDSGRNNLGNPVITPQRYSVYTWYDAAHGYYLAQVFESMVAPGTFAQYASYADVPGTPTGVTPIVAPDVTFNLAPNPAHGKAVVTLQLAKATEVDIVVTDLNGRAILHLAYPALAAGAVSIPLDTRCLPSGLYLVRLSARGITSTAKLAVE